MQNQFNAKIPNIDRTIFSWSVILSSVPYISITAYCQRNAEITFLGFKINMQLRFVLGKAGNSKSLKELSAIGEVVIKFWEFLSNC